MSPTPSLSDHPAVRPRRRGAPSEAADMIADGAVAAPASAQPWIALARALRPEVDVWSAVTRATSSLDAVCRLSRCALRDGGRPSIHARPRSADEHCGRASCADGCSWPITSGGASPAAGGDAARSSQPGNRCVQRARRVMSRRRRSSDARPRLAHDPPQRAVPRRRTGAGRSSSATAEPRSCSSAVRERAAGASRRRRSAQAPASRHSQARPSRHDASRCSAL